ncbi:lysylphosphatidylglycerol synthase domain-containing protein [uncultured Winogradskyella sp.]|uniref:lysylphosphatidylglycerol synthase domain-containing protein n=1 Tax=uncultured Winogradskyella sp. TaxID=395353 RepID=UPI0025FF1062|nr:lysylphosphatidylglycerol synthase domain-containing protein [uncultured Winogradskyella sp.]
MYGQLSYKSKQFFIAIIKLSIIVGASYYIYNKLLNNENLDFSEFISFLTKIDAFSTKNIVFLLFLTIFNWFFEILKWRILVSTIKKISFFEALEQSLGGLTASLITPNRIGDYGAKAIYFEKQYRKRIVFLNLMGNVSQMTITTILGIIGVVIFYSTYDLDLNYQKILRIFIIIVIVVSFSIFGLQRSRFKIKGFSIERLIEFIKNLPQRIHISNLGLSFIRYLIFSFQFYFFLQIFGVDIDYKSAMIVLSSSYLLASIVPSLAVFDVLIKTGAAVYLFSFLGVNELTILCISTLMWLLNFILPSMFGSYFVLNFKVPKASD